MKPQPLIGELLHDLDVWLYANIRLLTTDPDEWYRRMEYFVAYVVCRSYREGARDQRKRLGQPSEN